MGQASLGSAIVGDQADVPATPPVQCLEKQLRAGDLPHTLHVEAQEDDPSGLALAVAADAQLLVAAEGRAWLLWMTVGVGDGLS